MYVGNRLLAAACAPAVAAGGPDGVEGAQAFSSGRPTPVASAAARKLRRLTLLVMACVNLPWTALSYEELVRDSSGIVLRASSAKYCTASGVRVAPMFAALSNGTATHRFFAGDSI